MSFKLALMAAVFVAAGTLFIGPRADAAGCVSGAAVGAVAGHVAGHHAVLGAAAGCVAGHEMKKHDQKKAQQQATAPAAQ